MDGLVGFLDGFFGVLGLLGFLCCCDGFLLMGLFWGFLFGVLGFLYSFLVSFGFLVLFSSFLIFSFFPGFTTALQAASWGFTPHPSYY